jgi:hypothetical protein
MTKNSTAFFGFLLLLLLSLSSNAQQESPPLKAKLKNAYDTTKAFVREQTPVVKQKLKTFESKLQYGIGGNVAYSTTLNISKEKLQNRGFSGDSFAVEPTIEYAFFGVAQYSITPRLDVQLGIGYSKQSESIFIYPSVFLSLPVTPAQLEKHLEISLAYLSFPIQTNYLVHRKSNGQLLWLSIGVTPKYLLKTEDNYRSLIYDKVAFTTGGSTYTLTSEFAMTQRFFLFKKQQVDFSLFGSINTIRYIGGWGFLENLRKSKNVQLGVQMKYFF